MYLKRITVGFISVLLGIAFIFSAYIKLFPIEFFEFSFVEINVANWLMAPFMARLFISLEFFLGILLLLNFNGGNHLLAKATLVLLIFFTIYLFAIFAIQGNSGNCGCFGTYIKMTPLESILKNIVLMSFTGILFLVPQKNNISNAKFVVLATAISSLVTPFVLNPISTNHPPSDIEINYSLKLEALYSSEKDHKPNVDLRKGKKVVAFLSLTCPHCKLGAQKLNIIHDQHPELPIYFILNGEEAELKSFLEESKTKTISYSFMTLKEGFIENAGLNLPSILWVNNLKVENRTKYTELDADALISWFEK
jgi:hypothetical protein